MCFHDNGCTGDMLVHIDLDVCVCVRVAAYPCMLADLERDQAAFPCVQSKPHNGSRLDQVFPPAVR